MLFLYNNLQMEKYLKLLRAKQWVKNLFVFVPLFFSGKILDADLFLKSCIGFILFSLTASAIYIINDYRDIEADRRHPEKCKRPLAAGTISKKSAKLVFVLLIIAVLLIFYNLKNLGVYLVPQLGFIIGGYFVMNLFYTFKLKHVAIVDIFIIAIGFVLRVLTGGYVTGIPISQWTILLTFVLALVLAIGKRRGELINARLSGQTRRSLDGYNVQFADIALSISCALSIVCYLMFTITDEAQAQFGYKIFYTVVFVMFAFLRYLQQTLVYNKTESPTKIVYKDHYIQITMVLWLVTFLLLIYYK